MSPLLENIFHLFFSGIISSQIALLLFGLFLEQCHANRIPYPMNAVAVSAGVGKRTGKQKLDYGFGPRRSGFKRESSEFRGNVNGWTAEYPHGDSTMSMATADDSIFDQVHWVEEYPAATNAELSSDVGLLRNSPYLGLERYLLPYNLFPYLY